jgi:phosphatidylserine decarboxylase
VPVPSAPAVWFSIFLLLAAGWAFFARDPRRAPPAAAGLVAPADGRVLLVEQVAAPPAGISGPAWRLVIFLALWDVHVQRAPEAGRVALSRQQAGGHVPAMHPLAALNAGHWLGLETDRGPVLLLRTSGLLARRITTFVRLGARVDRGQRIGRIWLGSRAEIFFGSGWHPLVRPGEAVRAGETLIARPAEGPA